jgi:branched-chain amino acid transport system permease protein
LGGRFHSEDESPLSANCVQGAKLFNYILQGTFTGLIFSLVALGYTLVYGVLRLINFAHSEVLMTGGFAGYFYLHYAMSNQTVVQSVWLSLFFIVTGVIVSGIAGTLVAIAIERFAYRPLRRRNAPKLAYLISAIGASYFLLNLFGKEFGRYPEATTQPFSNHVVVTLWGGQFTMFDFVILVAALLLMVILDFIVSRTKMGRSIRAVAMDAETASLMGVNVNRTIASTFALGGFMGGAAGFFVAINQGISYDMGFKPALLAFTAAVLGGIGNVRGAMIGGVVLGIVMFAPIYWLQQPWMEEVIAFSVLVLILLFRPTGLLGERLGRSA